MTNQAVVVKTEVPSIIKSEIDLSQYNLDETENSQNQPQNRQSFLTLSSVLDLVLDYEDFDQEESQDLPSDESMTPMQVYPFLPESLDEQRNFEPPAPVTMDSCYSLTQLNGTLSTTNYFPSLTKQDPQSPGGQLTYLPQQPIFTNLPRIPQDGLFPTSTNGHKYSEEDGENVLFSSDIQHGTFNIHSSYGLYEQSTQPSASLCQVNAAAVPNGMPQFTIVSMGDVQIGNQPLSMQIQSDRFQLQNNQFSPVSEKSNDTNERFCDVTNTTYLTLEVPSQNVIRHHISNDVKVEVNSNHIVSSIDSSTVAIEDPSRPKCFMCLKDFGRPCYLAQHNKTHHSGDKPFKCFTCGKRFSDEQTRMEHAKRHKGDKPFKCNVCPKMFQYNTDLKRHLYLHTGTRLHVCEVCKKGFIRRDHMVKHTYVHKKKNAMLVESRC